MKVYITGGSGFVGSHLARRLAEDGHEVTVGGLNPEDSVLELPGSVDREKIDVTDRSSLDFEGFSTVIHLVALSPLREPSIPYRKIHVEGTENVVEEAEEAGIETYFHMSALGADPDGRTEYLRTKARAEKVVEDSGLDWRIFRPSVMFGEGGEFLDFISKLSTPFINLQPGRDTLFQPLYVEDAVEMIVESLKKEYSEQVFEIGGPEKLSMGEIVTKIKRSEGKPVRNFKLPDPVFRGVIEISDRIPFSPFGMDQYRSLKSDNVVEENEVEKLGFKETELEKIGEYLETR